MQGMFRFLGRIGAFIIGAFGAVIGFAINILYSGINDAMKMANDSATHVKTHGVLGFFLTLIGLIGALIAPFNGLASAVVMGLVGLGLFWVVGVYAIPASILLFIAAIMAYMDRTPGHLHPVLHQVKGAEPPSLPPTQ